MKELGTRAARTRATLVQYIELWNVESGGQSLTLQSQTKFRGHLIDSEKSDRSIQVGDGLAGMALNQRHAIILHESPSELLKRIGSKNGIELSALIAYPIMMGHEVLSVIVFGICAGPGAFEIWSRDDRDELSVSSSYYSGLTKFEFISRHVKFPKGAGLPGGVWKSGQPRLASGLEHNPRFMRSFAADEADLSTGLGLPVGSSAGNSDSVLLLLSSKSRPIAMGFEIWQPQATRTLVADMPHLTRTATDWSISKNSIPTTDAVIAEAWNTGRSGLVTETMSSRSSLNSSAHEDSARTMLTIPVYRGAEKAAVVLLGF